MSTALERATLAAGCAHVTARFTGVVVIKTLCDALGQWAEAELPDQTYVLSIGIAKSCLLRRLIYAGEHLRTRPCPIHRGRWSSSFKVCPAGCNFEVDLTGWLPNDLPDPVAPPPG